MNKINYENLVWIVIAVVLGLFLLNWLFSFGYWGYGGMMGMMYGYGAFPIFGWLFMILIIVALILFIVWLVKELHEPRRRYG